MDKLDKIKYIQNEVCKIYLVFLKNKSISNYENSCRKLIDEVKKDSDEFIIHFCENLVITYVPVVNEIKRIDNETVN